MDKIELCYQVALSKLERLHAADRDVDAKAARWITLATSAVGAAVVLKLTPDFAEQQFVAVVTLVAFVATLGLSLWALRVRRWSDDPELPDFKKYVESYNDATLLTWIGNQYTNAVENNRKVLKRKTIWVLWSQITAATLSFC